MLDAVRAQLIDAPMLRRDRSGALRRLLRRRRRPYDPARTGLDALHAGCRRGRWGLTGLHRRALWQTGLRPDLTRSWSRWLHLRGLVGLRQTGGRYRWLRLRGLVDLRLGGRLYLGRLVSLRWCRRLRALLRRLWRRGAFRHGDRPLLSRGHRLRRLLLGALRRRHRSALNACRRLPLRRRPLALLLRVVRIDGGLRENDRALRREVPCGHA